MARSEFVVARNPDPSSSLPFLVRIPLGEDGVVLKARDRWPRTAKVFCHPQTAWPADAEILERVPVRSCVRRGAAIDLVLDRSRENRSQLVFTRIRGGREAIFWQSARTTKQARPRASLPTRRSAAGPLSILVDHRERYPWRFSHQQATTERRPLPAGDYGVEHDGALVAVVERKSLADLASSASTGRLRYLLADLAALPRSAVVVEDRYSSVFRLEHVRPSMVADALAEAQVRVPSVPIIFAESRRLAEEWTYRFLGAALYELADGPAADLLAAGLAPAGPLPPPEPTTAEVRAWALAEGLEV
ncbi:MAG TPA: ERCC4 domain-containing protein, partial [Acidimicrobiales bacterium]|nr:ERCC4 domain-containing protein [Acidimicrobiales bacterium]